LASCGFAVGLGNLLRYPSVAWANHGLQWFIPFDFLASNKIGIFSPSSLSAFRSYSLRSHLGKCTAAGTSLLSVESAIASEDLGLPQLSMVWPTTNQKPTSLQRTTTSSLPGSWSTLVALFQPNCHTKTMPLTFLQRLLTTLEPRTKRALVRSCGKHGACALLPGSSFSRVSSRFEPNHLIFKGVNLLGKIVYFTMVMPIIALAVILIRGVTLENASQGIFYYVGVWRGEILSSPEI
jgi:solute carrier family 6 GABA transporter-like protein 1